VNDHIIKLSLRPASAYNVRYTAFLQRAASLLYMSDIIAIVGSLSVLPSVRVSTMVLCENDLSWDHEVFAGVPRRVGVKSDWDGRKR